MVDDTGIGDPPDGLTAAEIGMWQAFRNGSVYDLRIGRRDGGRSARRPPLGSGAQRARAHRVLAAPGRAARAAPAGSRRSSSRGVQITDVLDLAGGDGPSLRRAEALPLREGSAAARGQVHHPAPGGLLDPAPGGRPRAHGGRPASAALPDPQRHAAHRRPDRHRPADQPGRHLPRPARQLDHGRRALGRSGPAGRDDGVARPAEPARREGRRLLQPARQQARQSVRPAGAQRPADDRGTHALHDAGRARRSPHDQRHDTPARHPRPALRVPGRHPARRRPLRGRRRPGPGALHPGERPGGVAAPRPDAGAALPRRGPAARQGRPVRRQGRQPHRQVDQLAGPRRPPDGRLQLREPRPAGPVSRSPGG